MGKAKLTAAEKISGELGRKVVFDGTLPVDKTGVVGPVTGTIRLNSKVGGPENLYDNALQLVQEEQAGTGTALDNSELAGYNAGEEDRAWGTEGASSNSFKGILKGKKIEMVLIKNDPYHKVITNYQNGLTKDLKVGKSIEVNWPIPNGIYYNGK